MKKSTMKATTNNNTMEVSIMKDYLAMNWTELVAYAKEMGIGTGHKKKAQIISELDDMYDKLADQRIEEEIVPVGDMTYDKMVIDNKEVPYVAADSKILELTTEQKIKVAKAIKEACMKSKMRSAGVSLRDAQDVICEIVFQKKYWRIHTVQCGIAGVSYTGEIPAYKREAVSNVTEVENSLIGDTLTKMINQKCLNPNKEFTFFYLAPKLYSWKFAQ